MNHLPIDIFLDRIADMPDLEALEQLEMRRENAVAQRAVMTTARAELEADGRKDAEWRRLGQEVLVLCADLSRLTLATKQINRRRDMTSWAKAVTAIYGQEGFNACRQWMAMFTDRKTTP